MSQEEQSGKPWRVCVCDQTDGSEHCIMRGSEAVARAKFEEYADRGRDVWMIDPTGKKHLPDVKRDGGQWKLYIRDQVHGGDFCCCRGDEAYVREEMSWHAGRNRDFKLVDPGGTVQLSSVSAATPVASSCNVDDIEKQLESWLDDETRRLKQAGSDMAVAAIRVATEGDGVHRLLLAVAGWTKALADEGGRGK